VSILLEKQIRVNRIVTTSLEHAKAIEDPLRTKILEILYRKQLSAEQIFVELKKSGYKKALTTVRHHLEILKDCNLIEIVKIIESRGAVTKFYGTSTRLLGFSTPENFDLKYLPLIKTTSNKIEKLLKNISQKTSSKEKSKKIQKPEYNQYLIMEIVNRAITNIFENKD